MKKIFFAVFILIIGSTLADAQCSGVAPANQVCASPNGSSGFFGNRAILNADLPQMASKTLKGNNTGSTGNATDLTVAQSQALLFTGELTATVAVNFNSANTDFQLVMALPTGFTRYFINNIFISAASGTLTTATCGVFTATGGGGTAIVTGGTAITVSTASDNTANNLQSLSSASATTSWTVNPIYFRVQNAEGSAATGTVTIHYRPLS